MSKRLTVEEFINRANEIHSYKYDYSKVKFINTYEKVNIICPEHGEFEQFRNNHLSGHGCDKCGGTWKITEEEFLNKVNEIYNHKYDYSKMFYINCSTEIVIMCPIHGEFKQKPHKHISGKECKECLKEQLLSCKLKLFIEKSNKIHNCKYNYSKVIYKTCDDKVVIICPIHGEFNQSPSQHLRKQGCPDCNSNKLSLKIFVNRSNKTHNYKYNYSKVDYIDSKTKVKIICPKHRGFEQTPNHHLKGYGCPKCSHHISKPSQEWLDSFDDTNIVREKTIKIGKKRIRVDGFDFKTKTIYEFYGDYWHGNPNKFNPYDINSNNKKTFGELYNLTIEKEKLIKDAGYNLIIIWESDWKNGA